MADGRWQMPGRRSKAWEYSLRHGEAPPQARSNGRQEPALKQNEPSEARGAVDPIYLLDSSLSTKKGGRIMEE